MQVTTVGNDLAKNMFQLHGCDTRGKAVLRKQLAQGHWLGFIANRPLPGSASSRLISDWCHASYLRTLLVHGARSAMRTIERRSTVRSVWAGRLKLRRGSNVAAVALRMRTRGCCGRY
jgi:hypothetical protein